MENFLSGAEIDEIKAKNTGQKLYKGCLSWEDETQEVHTLEFIYRRPTVTDMEMMQKQAINDAVVASKNLFNSLVVSDKTSLQILDSYPKVMDSFLVEEVLPFFGSKVQTKSEAL